MKYFHTWTDMDDNDINLEKNINSLSFIGDI